MFRASNQKKARQELERGRASHGETQVERSVCRMAEQPGEVASAKEKGVLFFNPDVLSEPEVYYWMFSALTISGAEI